MMRSALSLACLVLAAPAHAHRPYPVPTTGSPVHVEVRVDGGHSPLYAAPDGSGRLYVEARKGAAYDVILSNRSAERVGVVLVVDGLNTVSGERAEANSPRNRMYILDPWAETTVRGWRTSLSEVRRFTFVDEERSYAARAGKANRKMGWIELGVFREKGHGVWKRQPIAPETWSQDRNRSEEPSAEAPMAQAPPPPRAPAADARVQAHRDAQEKLEGRDDSGTARSYPGTGWGRSAYDPAQLVHFDPLPTPVQLVAVRYEYAPALRALGILPAPHWHRDRLSEREQAQDGFAKAPAW